MTINVTVAACSAGSLRQTLEWLYRDLPPENQFAQVETAAAQFSPDDLIAATLDGAIVGAIVTQVADGRVGWLFEPSVDVPRAAVETRNRVASHLIAAGVARLNHAGVRLMQALLARDTVCGELLKEHGFQCITEMIRMVRKCGAGHAGTAELGDLKFVPFAEKLRPRFEDVVGQTYEASKDCPELDGLRPVSEILTGYQASGNFRADFWQLACRGDEAVGCVLLAEYPDERRCELQYMGVIPAARGRRLGASLCSRAIELADARGMQELSLSVDARNEPAIQQYRRAGFAESNRRRVFILQNASAAPRE